MYVMIVKCLKYWFMHTYAIPELTLAKRQCLERTSSFPSSTVDVVCSTVDAGSSTVTSCDVIWFFVYDSLNVFVTRNLFHNLIFTYNDVCICQISKMTTLIFRQKVEQNFSKCLVEFWPDGRCTGLDGRCPASTVSCCAWPSFFTYTSFGRFTVRNLVNTLILTF